MSSIAAAAESPPAAPLPFPPPTLIPVRRVSGLVRVPTENKDDRPNDASTPAPLKRSDSMSGNILVAKDGNQAYWIQRKIAKTTYGSIRIGFVLRPYTDSNGVEWEVMRSSSPSSVMYPYEMVAIKMLDKTKVMASAAASKRSSLGVKDATVELSALQMVADCNVQDKCHVVVPNGIFADDRYVYIVMPYHADGSLFEYVEESGGKLDEGVARHFFRQILQGLETLQQIGIYHRTLSLEHVLLRGTDCCLVHLGNSLRIPRDSSGNAQLLVPQLTVRHSDPQYMAPELLRQVPFDGHAVDLWAAGVMLFAMLFGNNTPFVWAVADDSRFRDISVKGNLETVAQQLVAVRSCRVSDQALDLLQSMLRADPENRLSLQDVMEHPWVVGNVEAGVVPPPVSPMIKMLNMG